MPPLGDALSRIFSELVDGPPKGECYLLNAGDPGLYAALDSLSAEGASTVPAGGGASIAAHVDHVLYGFDLLNRYMKGDEAAWDNADWTASWKRGTVGEAEWNERRARFRASLDEARRMMSRARDLEGYELKGAIGIVAHLAYHFGAIRQIDRSIRGPSAEQVAR